MKKIFLIPLLFVLLTTGCNSFNNESKPNKINNLTDDTPQYETTVFDVWDGTVASSFSSGTGEINDPYIIGSAEEFAYFRTSLAIKNYYQDKYLLLTANLDLNNIAWLGIGGRTSTNSFKGTFNGDNHIIKNINMNVTSSRKGLFNSNSGKISNLNIEGSLNGGVADSSCYGLFIGINYGEITNVTSKGNVNITGNYVSGFIGCNAGGQLTNCSYLDGTTFGTNCVGGIVGYNMVSSGKIGSLNNCSNYGTINAKDYPDQNYSGLGGIIGTCGSGATINNCYNYGKILGEGTSVGGTGGIIGNNFNTNIINCSNEGKVSAKEKVGGIVGHGRNASNVDNCTNRGNISGDIAVAGIIGYCRSFINNCTNFGEVEADQNKISYWTGGIVGMLGSNISVINCINNGYVHGLGSSNGGVGGIAGSNYASTIDRCTNAGLVQGLYRVGGILGYSQTTTGYVLNSINNGSFKSTAKYGTVSLGGIVGYNRASVIGCTNNGNYIIEDDISIEMYGYIIGYDLAGETLVYKNTNNA